MTDAIRDLDRPPSEPPTSGIIVITPAHNEEAKLEALADTMEAQTVRPDLWVIVDDRSTDSTARVAKQIAADLPFVETISRTSGDDSRNFAGKVGAFTAGYDGFVEASHLFVACVDADVLLPPQYFERVLNEFTERPRLGVTGGVYIDTAGRIGRHGGGSVPGPAQTFRRSTFDEMGGLRPLPRGGEDALACSYARKNGWETEAIDDLQFRHLRSVGTGGGRSKLRAAFEHGRQDWDVGMDPVFEVVRMLPRVTQRPYGIAVLARLSGYAVSSIIGTRQVDDDIMNFCRGEQRGRLLKPLRRYVRRSR